MPHLHHETLGMLAVAVPGVSLASLAVAHPLAERVAASATEHEDTIPDSAAYVYGSSVKLDVNSCKSGDFRFLSVN